jgi:hypothetical protein
MFRDIFAPCTLVFSRRNWCKGRKRLGKRGYHWNLRPSRGRQILQVGDDSERY